MDPRSRPDGEPQDEMSIFTSHGREEVLTTIKSAHNEFTGVNSKSACRAASCT
jgi:hypothetical protein